MNLDWLIDPHRKTAPLHALIPAFAFYDDNILVSKSRQLCAMFAVTGIDPTGMEPSELDFRSGLFTGVLGLLCPHHRLLQYAVKRSRPNLPASSPRSEYLRTRDLATIDLFFALTTTPNLDVSRRLHPLAQSAQAAIYLAESAGQFRNGIESFLSYVEGLTELRLKLLPKEQAFRAYHRLTNYTRFKSDCARLRDDNQLDWQLAESLLEDHRTHLRLDEDYVRVLTLKEPPSVPAEIPAPDGGKKAINLTRAAMLHDLYALPCDAILATEWHPVEGPQATRSLTWKLLHFHSQTFGVRGYDGHAHRQDRSAAGSADEIADGIAAVSSGVDSGEYSLTLILHDPNEAKLETAVHTAYRIMSTRGGAWHEETYNRFHAWLAVLPGQNPTLNIRRLWMTAPNAADLSLIWNYGTGQPRNEYLGAPALAILETRHGQPYHLNLHHQDVAHTLIVGASGTGKSFGSCFLLSNAHERYKPLIYIFDIKNTYEALTHSLGGTYCRISPDHPLGLNPFAMPASKESWTFQAQWTRMLIESSGYLLDNGARADLYAQIQNLYQFEPRLRRLSVLARMLPQEIASHLSLWTGEFGPLFDAEEDMLELSDFEAFDLSGMFNSKSPALTPLMLYLLHRVDQRIKDPASTRRLKIFLADEAWKFLLNDIAEAQFTENVRMWRSFGAAMIMVTQYPADLKPALAQACPTKLFFSNPQFNRDQYKKLFELGDAQIEEISKLIPKRQFLLVRPGETALLNLNVDPRSYWTYSNDSQDDARRREAISEHGLQGGIDALAKEQTH